MAIVSIPVGDRFGDGHEKCEYFLIEIPDQFTREVLMENYEKVKDELGFGLEDFAVDYEDSILPSEYLRALIVAGFDTKVFSSTLDLDDSYYLSADDMFHIAIFMASKDLEGFEYRLVQPDFELFGWTNMGYGVFY